MPEYRRAFVPGGTFFVTIVTHMRRPLFAEVSNVVTLYVAIQKTQEERPFTMVAYVVLPDHMHVIWKLPPNDSDFSTRVGRMKALFTKSVRKECGGQRPPLEIGGQCPPYVGERSPSQVKHRESGLWQRRFWEHTIRDEDDFERHVNYIHYNPVKHELATCPHAWRESSFMDWVHDGVYAHDWYCRCEGRHPVTVVEDMVETAGE
ncbi:MAG: transposase [Phycisphaerae bacterium]